MGSNLDQDCGRMSSHLSPFQPVLLPMTLLGNQGRIRTVTFPRPGIHVADRNSALAMEFVYDPGILASRPTHAAETGYVRGDGTASCRSTSYIWAL